MKRTLLAVALLATPLLGQELLRDLNRFGDDPSSFPSSGAVLGNDVYFTATTDGVERQLFRSRMSGPPTLVNLFPGAVSSEVRELTPALGGLLFFGGPANGLTGLWRTDGTAPGTVFLAAVQGVAPPSQPQFHAIGSQVLFIGGTGVLGASGVWRTDGTVVGTRQVLPLASTRVFVEGLVVAGNELFFAATEMVSGEQVLGRSDGTLTGTVIFSRTTAGGPRVSLVGLTTAGANVLFVTSSPLGASLWRTDGTAIGTFPISLGVPIVGTGHLTSLNNEAIFVAIDAQGDRAIYASDGTVAGTRPLTSFGQSYETYHFTVLRGEAYFFGNPQPFGRSELLATDGRTIRAVAPISRSMVVGRPNHIVAAANRLFIFGQTADPGSVRQLWVSDGTTAGTRGIQQPLLGRNGDGVKSIQPFGTGVFMTVDDGLTGTEPWTSDGTNAGTARVANLAIGGRTTLDSGPENFVEAAGLTWFTANDGVNAGLQLWSTDGTSSGTQQRLEFANPNRRPKPIASVRGRLVFALTQQQNDRRLFVSDGTVAGTQEVVGPQFVLEDITVEEERIVFFSRTATGHLLWELDDLVARVIGAVSGAGNPGRPLRAGADFLFTRFFAQRRP